MNIGALPDLILAWFKSQGTDMLQAGKESPAQGQFTPGQQYEGQVLDALPNGRNLVQVANQKLDMMLPQQARPGDVIRLTFLQAGPRPTFMLNSEPTAPLPKTVVVSEAAQQVSALARYTPTSATGAAPSVTLTTTAQAAASASAASTTQQMPAANAAAASPNAATPASTASSQTLMTAAPGNTAAALASTTAGTEGMAKPIIANPSLLLAAAPASAAPATAVAGPAMPVMMSSNEAVGSASASMAANPNLTAQGVAAQQTSVAYVLPMRLQQTLKESGMFYESHLGKWVRGEISLDTILREPQAALAKSPGHLLDLPDLAGMPEKAANMASRQLGVLESGTFVWQGQPWPWQNMEWRVTEREGGGNAGEEEMQKWHSQLNMTLPRLGGVSAALDIGALGLRIRLTAATPEAEAEMKAALPDLAQRMRAAELNLTSLQVRPAHGSA